MLAAHSEAAEVNSVFGDVFCSSKARIRRLKEIISPRVSAALNASPKTALNCDLPA
jgi:hypothetical protein